MKVNVTLDLSSVCLGVMVGLIIAPFIYDKSHMKHIMRKGAAKEVVKETKKGLFGKKEKTNE